jgi:RNA polymerase sigma-70 factor (sigma-E family)
VGPAWESEFAEYFNARVVAMRRLAYALCGDWHDAEDLTQVMFLRLYRQWPRARQQTLDGYCRRILVNAFLSSRRSRHRKQEVAVAVVPDRPDTAEPDGYGDLGPALAGLPPRRRTLVVLRYLEDMSVADVAALLGISEGTVKSQTSRALQDLRSTLGPSPGKPVNCEGVAGGRGHP